MNTNEVKTLITDAAQPASATPTLLVDQSEALPEERQRQIVASWFGGNFNKPAIMTVARKLLERTDIKLDPVYIAEAVVAAEMEHGFRLTALEALELLVLHCHLHAPAQMVYALMYLNHVVWDNETFGARFAETAAQLEDGLQERWHRITKPDKFGVGEEPFDYVKILQDYAVGGGTAFGAATQVNLKQGDQIAPGVTVLRAVPFGTPPESSIKQ